jgi:hypothetical protein
VPTTFWVEGANHFLRSPEVPARLDAVEDLVDTGSAALPHFPMRTHIQPVRTPDPSKDSEQSIEERKARLRGENDAWHLGRMSRDDRDPMAGLNGSSVDLTRVLRGRRFRR